MHSDEKKILLSIGILTYNHEKFIVRALNSVLMQEVNFTYEIIVGDDASGDNTPFILKDYQQRYPDAIKLILSEKNEGAFKNGKKIYEQSRGKYLCWFEGDDYWIYEKKLQTQVDFLESNT